MQCEENAAELEPLTAKSVLEGRLEKEGLSEEEAPHRYPGIQEPSCEDLRKVPG